MTLIRKTSIAGGLFAAAILTSPWPLVAQTAPGTAAGSAPVALNPFVVEENKDGSFRTTSVGSGSRLKVDLAETPVAYSVINREFIDALGITDMTEAASWATNQTWLVTDNGGMSNNSAQQYFQRGNTVSVGAGANSFGGNRNFFQNANQSNDAFSVETYDFGRGPNAALFGNGNGQTGGLGGVSSVQTKRTRFDRTNATVALGYGSWGYYRAQIDLNRPINERFGVRVNAVAQDQDGWRLIDSSRTRGLQVTSTWKITPTTELTIEGAHETRQQHSVGSGYDEYISGWDGVTVFRGPITNSMLSTTATPGATSVANASYGTIQVYGVNPITGTVGLTFNGEPNGVSRFGNNVYIGDMYSMTVMNYTNFPTTRRADATSRVAIWSATAPNGMYYQRASMPRQGNGDLQPGFGVGRMGQYTRNQLPEDMFSRLEANSAFRLPSYRWQGSFDTPTSENWSKDLQMTLTQRVGNNLFLDISGDTNRNLAKTQNFDQPNSAGEGFRSVTMDIDMILPDGRPNPNFLQPYSTGSLGGRRDWTADQAIRFNAVYTDLDLGAWGNYTFNFQLNASNRSSRTRGYTMSLKQNADPRQWVNERPRFRINWNDNVHGYTEPTALLFTDVTWDSTGNNPVVRAPRVVQPGYILGPASGFGGQNWSEQFNQQRYGLVSTTARYWQRKLVFTGAFRRDLTTGATKTNVNQGDLPATWDAQTAIFRPDAPTDYFTMTYVQRNATTGLPITGKPILSGNRPRTTINGVANQRDPLYINDRFRDDYNNPKTRRYANTMNLGMVVNASRVVSPYLNYSTTFTPPSSTSLDLYGEQRKAVTAYGYDMGANLNLLGGKLTVKLNYYKNVRENDNGNAPTTTFINALYAANRFDDSDTTTSGRNALGIDELPGNDYQNTRNDGREIELAATPIAGWRITLNGGTSSTATSNRFPLTRTYIPDNADTFLKVLQDAGGVLDTSRRPANAPNAPGLAVNPGAAGFPAGSPLVDQQAAVNAYNNIWANWENVVNGRVSRTPGQPIVNFFNDYTIQSGSLRGLRLGAGIRWQGAVFAGNRGNQTILNPADPTSAIDDPGYDTFSFNYGKGSYQTTATVAYDWRLPNGDPLRLNLVINNPINDKGLVQGDASIGQSGTIYRPTNGNLNQPARYASFDLISRFKEPINFRLTATYSFNINR